jgi:hypothetical protein
MSRVCLLLFTVKSLVVVYDLEWVSHRWTDTGVICYLASRPTPLSHTPRVHRPHSPQQIDSRPPSGLHRPYAPSPITLLAHLILSHSPLVRLSYHKKTYLNPRYIVCSLTQTLSFCIPPSPPYTISVCSSMAARLALRC